MNTKQRHVQEFGYRTPRFRADFRLLVHTEPPDPKLLEARCSDISEDGLVAIVKETLVIGSRVEFILTLSDSSAPVRIAARVNNYQDSTYGFTFVFSSDTERNEIHRYIAALRQSAASPHSHR